MYWDDHGNYRMGGYWLDPATGLKYDPANPQKGWY
jgi:hypothetical protein